jgi:hypothetical protein
MSGRRISAARARSLSLLSDIEDGFVILDVIEPTRPRQ